MCDIHDTVLTQVCHFFKQAAFRIGVQRGVGLVEHHQRGFLEISLFNRNFLPVSAGKFDAVDIENLSEVSIDSRFGTDDTQIEIGIFSCLDDSFVIINMLDICQSDSLAKLQMIAAEILKDNADAFIVTVKIVFFHIHAVDRRMLSTRTAKVQIGLFRLRTADKVDNVLLARIVFEWKR